MVIERKGVVDSGAVGLEEVAGVAVEGYDHFDVGVVEEEVVLQGFGEVFVACALVGARDKGGGMFAVEG